MANLIGLENVVEIVRVSMYIVDHQEFSGFWLKILIDLTSLVRLHY